MLSVVRTFLPIQILYEAIEQYGMLKNLLNAKLESLSESGSPAQFYNKIFLPVIRS